MPRRQRFKPSRKPKPAIEQSEVEVIQPTKAEQQQPADQLQPPEDRPQQS